MWLWLENDNINVALVHTMVSIYKLSSSLNFPVEYTIMRLQGHTSILLIVCLIELMQNFRIYNWQLVFIMLGHLLFLFRMIALLGVNPRGRDIYTSACLFNLTQSGYVGILSYVNKRKHLHLVITCKSRALSTVNLIKDGHLLH